MRLMSLSEVGLVSGLGIEGTYFGRSHSLSCCGNRRRRRLSVVAGASVCWDTSYCPIRGAICFLPSVYGYQVRRLEVGCV